MKVSKCYRDILIDNNPYYQWNRDEPKLMIYTPDIECYCNTLEQACRIIDRWIEENGTYEEYTFKADTALGINRLRVVK
jgi:hypothetical protein